MGQRNPQLHVVEDEPREPRWANLWAWLLALGGAIIVGSAVYTATHLDDRTVYTILIPGVVVGLVLVGLSTALRRTD
jgi:hypothetical protein